VSEIGEPVFDVGVDVFGDVDVDRDGTGKK
jgi:hypothetical protein